jgi:hypothetical protein
MTALDQVLLLMCVLAGGTAYGTDVFPAVPHPRASATRERRMGGRWQ